MRKTLLSLFCLLSCLSMLATHLVGGELTYTYLGGDEYQITLKVYRDCGPDNENGTGFDALAAVGIYENGSLYTTVEIFLNNDFITELPTDAGPCLEVPPSVCIEEAVYIENVTLPSSPNGYDLVYQRCCRTPAIINLELPGETGNTLWAQIPPEGLVQGDNSSPEFADLPPSLLCVNQPFVFDHAAIDPDGDDLVYSLCDPMHGASFFAPQPNPPAPPPFVNVTWLAGFDAEDPITADSPFEINELSGLITGTPTQSGKYAVGVCVQEYRQGTLISTVIRDFMYNVVLCEEVATAAIIPQDEPCEGTVFEFGNASQNAFGVEWDFGVQGIDTDVSTELEPTYNYPDTGTYVVTLIVNPGEVCADTAYQEFTAYPPIEPDFQVPDPFCAGGGMAIDLMGGGEFGTANQFLWTLDGPVNIDEFEVIDPPVVVYSEPGTYDISFTVYDDNCSETLTQAIDIPNFPVAAIGPQTDPCSGFDVNFTNESTGASTYWWDFGIVGSSDVSDEVNPSYTYGAYGTYFVTLIADPGSDCQDSTHLTVNVSPENPIQMAYDFNVGDPCDSVPGIDAEFLGSWVDEVTWDLGDGTVFNDFSFVYAYDFEGFYDVTVTAYNEICDVYMEDTFEVFYQEGAIQQDVLMPNVFSPTEDIWNERLRPFLPGEAYGIIPEGRTIFDYIENYSLQVYNRWGNLLFDSSGGINWWDGRINGELADEGVYYFIVTYKQQCETETKSYSGNVMLLHN